MIYPSGSEMQEKVTQSAIIGRAGRLRINAKQL